MSPPKISKDKLKLSIDQRKFSSFLIEHVKYPLGVLNALQRLIKTEAIDNPAVEYALQTLADTAPALLQKVHSYFNPGGKPSEVDDFYGCLIFYNPDLIDTPNFPKSLLLLSLTDLADRTCHVEQAVDKLATANAASLHSQIERIFTVINKLLTRLSSGSVLQTHPQHQANTYEAKVFAMVGSNPNFDRDNPEGKQVYDLLSKHANTRLALQGAYQAFSAKTDKGQDAPQRLNMGPLSIWDDLSTHPDPHEGAPAPTKK
jgi:hypothetical protein